MSIFPTAAVLLCLVLPVILAQSSTPCYDAHRACAFKFVNSTGVQRFSLSKRADRPFTPRIASKATGEYLGVLNAAPFSVQIVSAFSVRNITAFGGQQKFSPTQFKPFPKGWGSGIGHETFQRGQRKNIRGKCVRVFFSSYQLLKRRNGTVIGNVNDMGKEDMKCVAFRIRK